MTRCRRHVLLFVLSCRCWIGHMQPSVFLTTCGSSCCPPDVTCQFDTLHLALLLLGPLLTSAAGGEQQQQQQQQHPPLDAFYTGHNSNSNCCREASISPEVQVQQEIPTAASAAAVAIAAAGWCFLQQLPPQLVGFLNVKTLQHNR